MYIQNVHIGLEIEYLSINLRFTFVLSFCAFQIFDIKCFKGIKFFD